MFDQDIDINDYDSITLFVDWDLTTDDDDILTSDDIPSDFVTLNRDLIKELADLSTEDGEICWDELTERITDWLSDTYGWCVNYWEIDTYELID